MTRWRNVDERKRAWVIVGLLTLLALLLRLIVVQQSVWGDELFLLNIVHDRSLPDALSIVYRTESTPPLYFVAAWFSAHLGGDDALWIKVPSVLFGTATVPLVYLLGERTVGRRAGVVAAALIAVTTFDVFYGTEGRTYAALAFCCAAAALCVLELVETGGRRWVLLSAVAVAGAAYCHYTAVFFLVALLGWAVIVHRERLKSVLVAYAGALGLYAPWIPGALHQFGSNTSERLAVISDPLLFGRIVARAMIGHPFLDLSDIPGWPALALILAGLAIGATGLRWRPSARSALIAGLALVTPVAAALYQLTGSSFSGARYMSSSVPALALVLGAVVTSPRGRVAAIAAAALFTAGTAVGGLRGLNRDHRRPPYEEVARVLDREAGPSVPVFEVSITSDPPGRVLGFLFKRPHDYYPVPRPYQGAFALGRRAGRLYVVIPVTGERLLPYYGFEQRGFRLARRRRYQAINPLDLLTYEPVRRAR